MPSQPFRGVLVPVLTPFSRDGEPDPGRFVAFCRWLLDQGAGGLAIFGTTSEANSMAAAERMALLDRLIEAGIPPEKLMPGTGACSMTETAMLARHAVEHGCGGVLMLPPFYYKPVSDDGLFAFISGVVDKVASSALKVFLYHIPPVAVVGFSLDLVGRFIKAYPDTVVGLKDSSGDWNNTAALLDRYPGFAVFPGSEVFLLDGLRKGAAGCITASGNVNVPGIKKVYDNWQTAQADALQAEITTGAQDLAGLSDGAGVEAGGCSFPQRSRLGRRAPADAAARPGAIGGVDRGSGEDRLHPRRKAPAESGLTGEGRSSWPLNTPPPAPQSARPSTPRSAHRTWRPCGSGCTRS